MMQMTDMPITMMLGMGAVWLLVIIFLLLGIAAFIKYLRSYMASRSVSPAPPRPHQAPVETRGACPGKIRQCQL